jgi:hypothetical protein
VVVLEVLLDQVVQAGQVAHGHHFDEVDFQVVLDVQ